MGATALLIRESDQRSRGPGVFLHTLMLMLLTRPDWAHSISFPLSAVATAGLTLSAPGLEQQLLRCCPSRSGVLSGVGLVPAAATASFRIHTALRARCQSSGRALVGSPYLVGYGAGVVVASRFGRHWLLGRHRGRAALVSTHADPHN